MSTAIARARLSATFVVATGLVSPRAHADPGVTFDPEADETPAVHYAQLAKNECEAELAKRAIPYQSVHDARGVLAPVRLTGPLHGVTFHSGIPASQRASSPYEIADCRLVLALDDFAAILEQHDIVEVIHMSAYRPPAAKGWQDGRLGQRHEGALALDAGQFVKRDGSILNVEKDFHGRIGAQTCGEHAASVPVSMWAATELREIVCDAADAHLFNVMLTPNYNWPHRNHFHLEVTPHVRWFLVH